MDWLASWYVGQLITASLVFARLAAMLIAMPAFTLPLSRQLKLLLPLGLTLLVLPSLGGSTVQLPIDGVLGFCIAIFFEGTVGFLIGTVVQLLIVGIQVGGELISHATGLQLGGSVPTNMALPTNLISTLVGVLLTGVVFASGGHRVLVRMLLDSYDTIPIGTIDIQKIMIELLIRQLTDGMIAGIKFAAPVVAIVLLSNLLTGLLSRTLPQINILAVGLNLNAVALLAGLSVTIGAAGWLFQSELVRAAERMSLAW